jgi:hypothetical protein
VAIIVTDSPEDNSLGAQTERLAGTILDLMKKHGMPEPNLPDEKLHAFIDELLTEIQVEMLVARYVTAEQFKDDD